MEKIFKVTVIVLFTGLWLSSYSQNERAIDSLNAVTQGNAPDTSKILAYSQLSVLWLNVDNSKSLQTAETGLKMAEQIKNDRLTAICLNKVGNVYTTTGEYIKSIECFERMLELCIRINDSLMMAKPYLNMGNAYRQLGKYAKATELYHKSLQIYEKFNDERGIANLSVNLSIVYYNLRDFENAKALIYRSIGIYTKINNPNIAYSYLNLGNIFDEEGVINPSNYDSALVYLQKSYQLFEKAGNKKGMSMINNNIASVYTKQKKFDQAEHWFLKALDLGVELQDRENIAISYKNLAAVSCSKRNYSKAIDYANKSIKISKDQGMLETLAEDLKQLSSAYDSLKKPEQALDYLKQFIDVNDSLRNVHMRKNLSEIQTKYETEKKQKEIEIQQVEIKQQKTQKVATIVGLLLSLVLLVVALYSYRRKRKDNILLESQKREIEEKNEELYQQNEEIAAQRDLVNEQKEKIEKIHSELTSSIRYSKRIQQAILPVEEKLATPFFESFIFYMPRDVVSGDFYWVSHQGRNVYFAVADCTGHGVPGALMSMLGISFLNEIIDHKNDMLPSEILDQLREYIIKSLKQRGILGEQKDGMDISVIRLNQTTRTLDYAGAYNSMFLFRNGNAEMEEIKANKMPVAIHEKMQPFTNHTITLGKDDILYLFTDGYKDQFGGPEGKKFTSLQFKMLLKNIYTLPVAEQKEFLSSHLNEWIGQSPDPLHQTDDITVLGLRIQN